MLAHYVKYAYAHINMLARMSLYIMWHRFEQKHLYLYIVSCAKNNITFKMFSVRGEGPLAEKYATTGAGLDLGTSIVGRIVALGFLS